MSYKRLIIWVEGEYDIIFFNNILKEKFEKHYSEVVIREYCGDQIKGEVMNRLVCKLINALEDDEYLNSSEGKYCPQDYIFVKDFDSCTCYTNKKEEIKGLIPCIDTKKILIVQNMIESWFLSGLNDENCRKVGISHDLVKKNKKLHKNNFYDLLPKKMYKRHILLKMTRMFDFNQAMKNNDSFKYCIEKFGLS